jgi:hypothetical protein
MTRVKPLFEGIRRPEVLQIHSARDSPTGFHGMKELSLATNRSLRQRSLGSQENWSTTVQGLCTQRDWRPSKMLGLFLQTSKKR